MTLKLKMVNEEGAMVMVLCLTLVKHDRIPDPSAYVDFFLRIMFFKP